MKRVIPLVLAALLAAPATATTLRITVTNDAGPDGFALTPVYTAFHNGNFDSYDLNAPATDGLEALAEVGNFGLIRDERIAAAPGSSGAVFSSFTADGDRRPLFGGESATVDVDITDPSAQRYFSYLSMIIPTNDIFIANGNPLAFELFDDMGIFAGDRTISVTGAQARDAGTEVNDRNTGVAFADGQNGAAGADEGGVVTAGYEELIRYVGLPTAGGFTINSDLKNTLIDTPADQFAVATITIEQIAPVPLPAGGALMLSALGIAGFVARRRVRGARG